MNIIHGLEFGMTIQEICHEASITSDEIYVCLQKCTSGKFVNKIVKFSNYKKFEEFVINEFEYSNSSCRVSTEDVTSTTKISIEFRRPNGYYNDEILVESDFDMEIYNLHPILQRVLFNKLNDEEIEIILNDEILNISTGISSDEMKNSVTNDNDQKLLYQYVHNSKNLSEYVIIMLKNNICNLISFFKLTINDMLIYLIEKDTNETNEYINYLIEIYKDKINFNIALMETIKCNNLPLMKIMIDNGANNINEAFIESIKDSDNCCFDYLLSLNPDTKISLSIAAELYNLSTLKKLLDHGIRDNDGSLLYKTVEGKFGRTYNTFDILIKYNYTTEILNSAVIISLYKTNGYYCINLFEHGANNFKEALEISRQYYCLDVSKYIKQKLSEER